ncbi:TM0106 family RecB-like putative nuclease [Microterricola viridarii]|uniref:DNA helicase n=1 Tax=Microterricola viridarii TaxID=412690 RepID=A0A109QX71_9MICO|nr:bifunctional RecB family nuclease/DEAD/DEAH box helicase [Microterricola viridarii]AMB59209.1 DNA helicase [Microterricola viridarii]
MFLLDDVVVTSASDLATASKCEFAFLRSLDAKLGRTDKVAQKADAMLERAGRLGDAHEAAVLERYRAQFGAFDGVGTGVVEIERPSAFDADARDAALAATREAFESGAAVVFQAAFFDGDFIGFADFIVRQPDGRYLVQDTKLARSVRVTALLQLVAYVEQLEKIGVSVADTVQLLLGDGSTSEHRVADILPVYRRRRAHLLRIIADRRAETGVLAWGDPRYTACGQCESCEAEIQAHRDVFLVAGLRGSQRLKLRDAGIRTIDELAALGGDDAESIDGIGDAALAGLRAQARLQLRALAEQAAVPPFEVVAASALEALPATDPGDIFFDFEGDPLYSEQGGADGSPQRWGLDYLFGLIEPDHTFRAFWAHNHAEERQALIEFLAYVAERRAAHPGMHIYHYAAYERTHLLSLAARHGVGEAEVDQLLRDNVLIDLYPIVRGALRVGSRSYSIKKLEPLYMGEEHRDQAGVTNAADSITEYAEAMALLDAGETDAGRQKLDEIASYNEYDCRSTLELRDWLLGLAHEHGVTPATANADRDAVIELAPSPLRDALLARAGDPLDLDRGADQTAAAFAAAALDYHQREQKSFWWEHFARLENPIADWADTRDVLVVESATVERDWHREGKQRVDRRWLRLRGAIAPGSSIKKGDQAGPFLLYDSPAPWPDARANPWARAAKSVQVLDVDEDGGVLVLETLYKDAAPYDNVPVALTPGAPPPAGAQKDAIAGWAQAIVDAGHGSAGSGTPAWPRDPVVDLLRRVPPRLPQNADGHAGEQPASASVLDQVIAATLALDHAALAVQGPPGTGKTYLGAHLITELVEKHNFKIGVVAQSHAVVENLLEGVVKAGLDRALVGKVPKSGTEPGGKAPGYTELEKNSHLFFALDHAESGFVIGGTAWDFANPARFSRRSLDLLVIDEAGQFSLASTIAASVAATNLLLLGDPQQLPQVSQGTHPEPVDQSALGWVSAGHDVLPAEFGFFLAESRRMHPAVTAPVSALSYEGALQAHPVAAERLLEGITPGLHAVPVPHRGNSTESVEEAAAVVELVRGALGRAWSESAQPGDGQRMSRPLEPRDVIVVTPYNAQMHVVHAALAAAGLGAVRVGTVDKFQGQEAAIAIVSLAASSAEDVPRGMSFLIMKNRLNVAISRAKWAAYLLHSPALIEYLPVTPDGLAELSAFIRLVEAGQ